MVAEPEHVAVVGCGDAKGHGGLIGGTGFGARVQPFVDFCVAVEEGEAARAAVVAGRVIEDGCGGSIVRVGHPDAEGAVVDAVGMFVEKDMHFGGGSFDEIRAFEKNFEAGTGYQVIQPRASGGIGDGDAHGDAADAADATGVVVTVNQLAIVIGVATFGTLYLNQAGQLPGPGHQAAFTLVSAHAVAVTFAVLAAAALAGGVLALIRARAARLGRTPVNAARPAEVGGTEEADGVGKERAAGRPA